MANGAPEATEKDKKGKRKSLPMVKKMAGVITGATSLLLMVLGLWIMTIQFEHINVTIPFVNIYIFFTFGAFGLIALIIGLYLLLRDL